MRDCDFFSWRREMLTRFQHIQDGSEVYALLQQQTQQLEFDYYSFCVRHPVPFTRPKITVETTYPKAWWQQYTAENYFLIDPVLKPHNYERGHVVWEGALFTPDTLTFWDAARDHGLRQGFTQCVISPERITSFLSVSRTSTRGQVPNMDELAMRLQLLGELSMFTLIRLGDPTMLPLEMKLSKREREILQWTGEGKTSAEIAMILSISENTVNFHQKNMQKKFNAPNKTQIACYAAATGII
ncbi:transcriptional regulator SdiA [Siccibacter colletis]|uniref:transcriptional regulator SdiA n=1 Tax=Siccibacter colletis TaxID=1505757 RepID=UPI0004E0B913|nr:transcriptional regulator SdiA [Siccibacter colletis]